MPGSSSKKYKINNYEILKLIGKGGMGELYLAKHPTLKREIILKKLKIRDKESSERFLKEAKVMLDFRHENIVQIFDHFKDGQSNYIAMEYVKGKSLNELINDNKKIPIPLALFILYQTALGIHHAHVKKVVHRDIKPGNILISTAGQIKITDFGIAKTPEDTKSKDITMPGFVVGTPAYMSPEQFNSSKNITYQSDIYSLGVVFYEMITGVKPFKNELTAEVINAITKGKYMPANRYVEQIPPIIKKILSKTFNHKESKRYKNLIPLIKILKKHFKKFNIFEIRDSVKRLLLNDKNIEKSAFFVHYKKQKRSSDIAIYTIFGFIFIGAAIALFVYTDRYYEWIVPDKFGKIIIDFDRANLDADNIFLGIDGKYEKAVFKKRYNKLDIKNLTGVKTTSSQEFIEKSYKKVLYLSEGEHEISVVSGSYKNLKKIIVSPRKMQKQSRQQAKGQTVSIPIVDLWSQEVVVYFRFWDSINNRLLFRFQHYPNRKLNDVKSEEDNLLILYKKSYMRLKDYVLMRKDTGLNAFYSNAKYFFLVKGFTSKGVKYKNDKFNLKFALDERTITVHVPLVPEPSKIKIVSNTSSVPIYINNENKGLIYKENSYEYTGYKSIRPTLKNDNKYYTELFIPPGKVSIKITKRGRTINRILNSSQTITINLKKQNGKYIY